MANSVGQFTKDVQFLGDPAIFYQADEFRAAFDLWTPGVRSGGASGGQQVGSFAVFPGTGMTVNIGTGVAIIEGGTAGTESIYSGLSATGNYMVEMTDSSATLTLGAASATLTRNDLICLRVFDTPGAGVGASNEMRIVVVAGTPGAGDPAIPTNSLVLSRVVVTANKTSIVATDIIDLRALSVPASLPGFFAANGYPLPAGTQAGGSAGPTVTVSGGNVTAGGVALETGPQFQQWQSDNYLPLAQRVSNLELASGGAVGTQTATSYGVISAGSTAWSSGVPGPGSSNTVAVSFSAARGGWITGALSVQLTLKAATGIIVMLATTPTFDTNSLTGSFTARIFNANVSATPTTPSASDSAALQWVVFGARQDTVVA